MIHLLAWQLYYRVRWRTVNGECLNCNDSVKLVISSGSTTAQQPWDAKGNDIWFIGRCGSFVIQGYYIFFSIFSPSRFVSLKLEIEAFQSERANPYYVGNFCVKTCTSSTPTYNNRLINGGIAREVAPNFIPVQQQIMTEFNQRTFITCAPPITTDIQFGQASITAIEGIYGPRTILCENTYFL